MASGLDTQSIIAQLMAVDRAPEARMKLQTSAAQARQSTLTDIATRVRNLLNTAKDLGSVTTWIDTQSLDVSDSSKVSATRLSGAAPGGHDITVSTLARSEQRSYAFTKGAGTLNLGSTAVAIGADDDGQTVADKINAASGSPFYAVLVQDPTNDASKDRLVLTRKDTGYYDPSATGAVQVTGSDFA